MHSSSDVFEAYWELVARTWRWTCFREQDEDPLAVDVARLLDDLAITIDPEDMAESAREMSEKLGQLAGMVGWNLGLRKAIANLVLRLVQEAELFGHGTGERKRRFAIDVVIRILRRDYGLPVYGSVEALAKPFLGIFVDWTVQLLKTKPDEVWQPGRTVKMPTVFKSDARWALALLTLVLRSFVRLRLLFLGPFAYERRVRGALRYLRPQIRDLLEVLPPGASPLLVNKSIELLIFLGQTATPYIGSFVALIELSRFIAVADEAERRARVIEASRQVLVRAYRDSPGVVSLLQSPLGDFFLAEMVETMEWMFLQVSGPVAGSGVLALPATVGRT